MATSHKEPFALLSPSFSTGHCTFFHCASALSWTKEERERKNKERQHREKLKIRPRRTSMLNLDRARMHMHAHRVNFYLSPSFAFFVHFDTESFNLKCCN